MSETPTPPPDAVLERVRAELLRHAPRLVPGAVEALAPLWRELGLAPDQLAERVSRKLAIRAFEKYLNPEYVEPRLPNGAPMSPLRTALLRHADQLKAGAVDALVARLGTRAAGLDVHAAAGLVSRELGRREVLEQYSRTPPPAPPLEAALLATIREFFPEVGAAAAEKLARESRQLLHKRRADQVRAVAVALNNKFAAAAVGVEPLDGRDWRARCNPTQVPDRPADTAPRRSLLLNRF